MLTSAPTGRPRLAILDIFIWVEKFTTMATGMVQRFPLKKHPSCSPTWLSSSDANTTTQWISYDHAFQSEALALPT